MHVESVSLVLNSKTLHLSPQFHVVFDDKIPTVPVMRCKVPPSNYVQLVDTGSSELTTDENCDLSCAWTFSIVAGMDTELEDTLTRK